MISAGRGLLLPGNVGLGSSQKCDLRPRPRAPQDSSAYIFRSRSQTAVGAGAQDLGAARPSLPLLTTGDFEMIPLGIDPLLLALAMLFVVAMVLGS